MIGDNVNKTVKRYTDIEKIKASRLACRSIVITVSVAVGIIIVAVSVVLAKKFSNKGASPPSSSSVNDEDYISYLQAPKILPIWSWTNESKYNNEPAYLQLYVNSTLQQVLIDFVKKHQYTDLMLYAGSAQYDSDSWQMGSFRNHTQFDQFATKLRKETNASISAVVYLNDDPKNANEFQQLSMVTKAINNFNLFQQNSGKIKKLLVHQQFNSDNGYNLKLLEALYKVSTSNSVNGVDTLVLVNMECNQPISSTTLDMYQTLSVVQDIISGMTKTKTINNILKELNVKPVIFLNGSAEYEYLNTIRNYRNYGFSQIYAMNNATSTSGEDFLNMYQQLIINSKSVSSDVTWLPDSYYAMFKTMYQAEPTQKGWTIDLYKPNN